MGLCLLLILPATTIGQTTDQADLPASGAASEPAPRIVAEAPGPADPALACYRNAAAGDPDPYPCDLAIRVALDAGDNARAAIGHGNRALILAAGGRLELALEDQQAALQLAPDDPRLLTNHGSLLLQHRQPREALGQYHRLVTLHPDDPASYYNRAFAYRALGDIANAAADVAQAAQLRGRGARERGSMPDTADAARTR
jgi:tetratricopeptide (TPR) repeat protein